MLAASFLTRWVVAYDGHRKKTQAYFIESKGKEAGTMQTKQELGEKEKGKRNGVSECWRVGGGGFLLPFHLAHNGDSGSISR